MFRDSWVLLAGFVGLIKVENMEMAVLSIDVGWGGVKGMKECWRYQE